MAKTNVERQRAFQARRKALRQQQEELVLEVLDGIADGSNGITCVTTTDLWGIHFDWDVEQSVFDVLETRANTLGFTIGAIQYELEQIAVKRYQAQVDAKEARRG